MTDLTPELEKWLGDEEAKNRWQFDVMLARTDMEGDCGPIIRDKSISILHAHALHLQQQAKNAEQQATIERLKTLLEGKCVTVRKGNDAGTLYETLFRVAGGVPQSKVCATGLFGDWVGYPTWSEFYQAIDKALQEAGEQMYTIDIGGE